ncbi:MAG: hypothetical protein M1831_003407 [Alyxoria varia]|nr:MAG: hypothetical protein M1831_003407 [Alyxoria varia]
MRNPQACVGFSVLANSALTSTKLIAGLIFALLFMPQATWAKPFPSSITEASTNALKSLYRVFQVYPPAFTHGSPGRLMLNGEGQREGLIVGPRPSGCEGTTRTLIEYHVFAFSYGQPYVGPYTPPDCDFNRATFNLTVVSAGRQFDRMGSIWLGDTEVWRTSTAEPTKDGIVWTYVKDMSHYNALLQEPQKLIFDLPNLINEKYTASLNVTLRATFSSFKEAKDPADLIIPVSARKSSEDEASAWSLPSSVASNSLTLPRNIRRAVFSIAANGQIDEEFWFGNVLSSDVEAFPQARTLNGFSPFREVQLLIDDSLAGVVWPFPIIFTGGVVPGLWLPIVGIDAFDLKEDEIDITPFLPVLCDGREHTFEIRVTGISDDGRGHGVLTKNVGQYWVVSGKIFIWEASTAITSGAEVSSDIPSPNIEISSRVYTSSSLDSSSPEDLARNESLTYDVSVSRHLKISSTFETGGSTKHASWTQDLEYSNHGVFTNHGWNQITDQVSRGREASSAGYSRKFKYPVHVKEAEVKEANGDFSLDASMKRAQDIRISGEPIYPTGIEAYTNHPGIDTSNIESTHLYTSQNGTGYHFESPRFGFGSTEQTMTFSITPSGSNGKAVVPDGRGISSVSGDDISGERELYGRHVIAANTTIVEDEERYMERAVQRPQEEPTTPSPIDSETSLDSTASELLMRSHEEDGSEDESRLGL